MDGICVIYFKLTWQLVTVLKYWTECCCLNSIHKGTSKLIQQTIGLSH